MPIQYNRCMVNQKVKSMKVYVLMGNRYREDGRRTNITSVVLGVFTDRKVAQRLRDEDYHERHIDTYDLDDADSVEPRPL